MQEELTECPFLEEPGRECRHGWVEDHARSNTGADAYIRCQRLFCSTMLVIPTLSQDELIVLGSKAGHHQAEDFEERADDEQPSRSVVVVDLANERPEEEHEEGLQ